jgi:hypothetical protein
MKIEHFLLLSRDNVLGLENNVPSSQEKCYQFRKNLLGLEEQYSSFRFMKLVIIIYIKIK